MTDLLHKCLRVAQEGVTCPRWAHKEILKLSACPLNAVIDEVRKVSESAHWHSTTLVCLPTICVRDGLVWHHDVNVGPCSHRPRFEQWQLVKDALAVNVEPSRHVVEGVADQVLRGPKVVVEDVFGLWSHQILLGVNLEVLVHCMRAASGGDRLGLPDVVTTEEELTVQIRHFDRVVVGDGQHPVRSAAHTKKRKVLDVSAPSIGMCQTSAPWPNG
jgi:hypothetical protein